MPEIVPRPQDGILLIPSEGFRKALLDTEGSSRLPTRWSYGDDTGRTSPDRWIYGLPVGLPPGRLVVALEVRWDGEDRLAALDRLVRVVSRAHVGKLVPYQVTSMALEHTYTPNQVDLLLHWAGEQEVGTVLRFPPR